MPNKLFIPLGLLITSTLVSGSILASNSSFADAETATATVRVASACTMVADSSSTAHTYTILPGNSQEGIGVTKLKTICNDTNGYAIYAIGFSGDTETNTNMIGTSTGLTIPTGTATGNVSNWSMKLEKDTTAYNPANLTITPAYTSYHAVPDDYTLVASFAGTTDTTNGSIVKTTYAVRVANNQAADTYIGKVKYVMVHPSNATAPTVTSNGD